MQAVSEAQGRLNASMLAQERESQTRRARLEVLERFISEHLNDAIIRLPEETLNLHRRLTTLEESTSKSQMEDRTIASMVDNHQEWQTQVEARMSDIMTDLQLKEIKLNELQNSQSTNSHSRNDRVEDKLILLERQIEEQRRKILHLESIPRMTKAELNTPDKEVNRKLEFQESAQSSHSHSHNANVGNPIDSSNDPNQGQQPAPPPSHSGNDQGGTGCAELRETVRRLTFWIRQITGVMDLGENPDDVSFPNWQTCRQLSKLKNEVEALQQKCKECHSKIPGGDQSQLEKNVEALKKGLNVTMGRLDQFLSHQKRDHAQVQELQRDLGLMRDELAAWAVHFQQQELGRSEIS